MGEKWDWKVLLCAVVQSAGMSSGVRHSLPWRRGGTAGFSLLNLCSQGVVL